MSRKRNTTQNKTKENGCVSSCYEKYGYILIHINSHHCHIIKLLEKIKILQSLENMKKSINILKKSIEYGLLKLIIKEKEALLVFKILRRGDSREFLQQEGKLETGS